MMTDEQIVTIVQKLSININALIHITFEPKYLEHTISPIIIELE